VSAFSKRRVGAAESEWNDPREAELMTTAVRVIPKHELTRIFAAAEAQERVREPVTPGEAFERILTQGAKDSDTLPYPRRMRPPNLAEYDETTTLVMRRRHVEDDAATVPRVHVAARPRRRRFRRVIAAALMMAVVLGSLSIDPARAGRVYRTVLSGLARR
jgi:hypothetical protein